MVGDWDNNGVDAVGVYRGNEFFVPVEDMVQSFWLGVVGDVPLAGNWGLVQGGGGETTAGGELLWAKHAGGADLDVSNGVAVDAAGNSLVTGVFFSGTATFGAGEPNATVLTKVGGGDAFLAKYTPDGSLLWAKRAGGPSYQKGSGVAVDAHGNILMTGGFLDSITFAAGEPKQTVLTAVDGGDIFLAQYAPDGSLLWVKQAGGLSARRGKELQWMLPANAW